MRDGSLSLGVPLKVLSFPWNSGTSRVECREVPCSKDTVESRLYRVTHWDVSDELLRELMERPFNQFFFFTFVHGPCTVHKFFAVGDDVCLGGDP